jgi:NAD-dependent dihydropyrimidine dehydrogenase PreA subunit
MNRKIVRIDEKLCDGCGLCVPNCAEGALKVIDGKARLVADNLCDGLGACLGECPRGAITVEDREAEAFDERVVAMHLTEIGRRPAALHGGHGGGHSCPSARAFSVERPAEGGGEPAGTVASELTHWPVKLQLVPPSAPFFRGRELVVAADCASVALGDFHRLFLRGNAVVIQCPKFGEQGFVVEKLAGIFASGGITGVTVVRMEVPCCGGLSQAVGEALRASSRADLPVREVVVGARGEILSDRRVGNP